MLRSNPVVGRAFLLIALAKRIFIVTAILLQLFAEGDLLYAQTRDNSNSSSERPGTDMNTPSPRASEPHSKGDAAKARQNYQELKNSNPCTRQPSLSWCK